MSQFLGAIIAGGFVFIQMNDEIGDKVKEKSILGIPQPGSIAYDINPAWGEIIGSIFLMYIYLSVTDERIKNRVQNVHPWAIGLIIYLVMNTIGEISGGSINPARSIGPSIVAG